MRRLFIMCYISYVAEGDFRKLLRETRRMGKKKDRLIPLSEAKRVIYLEERGRNRKKLSAGAMIFGILGAICIIYCICISIAGFGSRFYLVWGVLGAAFFLVSWVFMDRRLINAMPGWLKAGILGVTGLGLLIFIVVMGMILARFEAGALPGADYLIVLGAQWKADGPSQALRLRLDRAAEYLLENPGTRVIVSGGQGSNEPVSEAAGMEQYLIDAGIAPERITKEDRSTNTFENLRFSGELLDRKNSRVVIVTNNFHVFRAMKIAEKQGYANVEGMAAGSVLWMNPNNLLREFLGVIKDFLVGNL